MGVTRERIRQIRERAFEKLRQSPDGNALSRILGRGVEEQSRALRNRAQSKGP